MRLYLCFLQISKNNYAYISLKFPAEMSSSGSKTPVIFIFTQVMITLVNELIKTIFMWFNQQYFTFNHISSSICLAFVT